jgi:hypothetical protein
VPLVLRVCAVSAMRGLIDSDVVHTDLEILDEVMCPHTAIYLSSYYRICVFMLLYLCPHPTTYVFSYYYIGVRILLYVSAYYQVTW